MVESAGARNPGKTLEKFPLNPPPRTSEINRIVITSPRGTKSAAWRAWFDSQPSREKRPSKGYIRGSDASRGRERRRRRRGLVIKRPASRIRPPPTFSPSPSLYLSLSLHPLQCLQYTSRFRCTFLYPWIFARECLLPRRKRAAADIAYYTLFLSLYIYINIYVLANSGHTHRVIRSNGKVDRNKKEKGEKRSEKKTMIRWRCIAGPSNIQYGPEGGGAMPE